MTWYEWLFYLYDRRNAERKCRRHGHDIIGPEVCMDRRYRYHCRNCSYRFLTSRVIEGFTDDES